MLSDERLHQLLRDAHALESFEREAATAPRSRSTRWVIAVAASIAVLACAGVILMQAVARSQRTIPPFIVFADPAPRQQPAAQAPPMSSLLLAVYQNDSGKLSCVNWSADALKGRNVSSLTTEELTRLGLTLACDPQAARILVVGLEGPTASLPSSDARAHLVAQCLSTTPPCASGTFNPRTCASAGCLDTEVKVRVESLALK